MRLLIAATALSFVSLPAMALAQAAPAPPPPRHEGAGEISFVGVSGNASSQTIGLTFETVSRPAPWLFRQRVGFVRNESSEVLTAQSIFFATRAERAIAARLSAFGDYGYFRDRFAGVLNRHTGAAGLAAKLAENARHQLTADAGVGYLQEERLTGGDVSSAIYAIGGRYRLKISETAEIADDVGFVGTFDAADDWRFVHTISLAARITGALSLKISNGVRHANTPAPGFKRTDTITSFALVAKFTRP
jgi:putative salt-induced outer membrane protein YdiY